MFLKAVLTWFIHKLLDFVVRSLRYLLKISLREGNSIGRLGLSLMIFTGSLMGLHPSEVKCIVERRMKFGWKGGFLALRDIYTYSFRNVEAN